MSESEVFEYLEHNADEVAGIVMAAVRGAVAKQNPIPPVRMYDVEGKEVFACSKCIGIVKDKNWRANYCPECGQKVEWDDE